MGELMVRRWGVVLMAAAGLTIGAGSPAGTVSKNPGKRLASARGPQNQRITFVRGVGSGGESIRATARGPVDGFGTAQVIDFRPDPASGRFRGAWQLSFPAGEIRYVFAGRARERSDADGPDAGRSGIGRAVLAVPGQELVVPGAAEAVRQLGDAPNALVRGTFELLGGTGRFARVAGRGIFQGWTMPGSTALLPVDDVD